MKIYVDMNDVLVDFRGGLADRGIHVSGPPFYANPPETWTPQQRQQVEDTAVLCGQEDFWRNLRLNPRAFELLSACATRAETHLLSAFPRDPSVDREMVRRVKQEFARDVMRVPLSRVIVCERDEKALHARGNVLIDDYEKNIREWVEAGGTGILHSIGLTGSTIRRVEALVA